MTLLVLILLKVLLAFACALLFVHLLYLLDQEGDQ